jgi:hypothetical protein
LHNRVVKIAAWVIGIVAIATIAALSQGEQGNDLSTLPRPSRAFCSAAAKYDEATTTKPLPVARHVTMTHAIAETAPADTKSDAVLVWTSYKKLAAGDRSVVDDPTVKAAIDHVNRRATQTCGWFKRDSI